MNSLITMPICFSVPISHADEFALGYTASKNELYGFCRPKHLLLSVYGRKKVKAKYPGFFLQCCNKYYQGCYQVLLMKCNYLPFYILGNPLILKPTITGQQMILTSTLMGSAGAGHLTVKRPQSFQFTTNPFFN